MPHSHIQAVQQGLELLQAQSFTLAVPLEEILQEGGCGELQSHGIPARPDPRAGEKAEQHEQAAAPGACAGDHGVSVMLEEKPRAAISFSIPSSFDHRSSTPQLHQEMADFFPREPQAGEDAVLHSAESTQIPRRNIFSRAIQDQLLLLHPEPNPQHHLPEHPAHHSRVLRGGGLPGHGSQGLSSSAAPRDPWGRVASGWKAGSSVQAGLQWGSRTHASASGAASKPQRS